MQARFHRPPLAKEGRTLRRTAGCSQPARRRKGKYSACRSPEGVNLEDTSALSPPGQGPVIQGRCRPARPRYGPRQPPSPRSLRFFSKRPSSSCNYSFHNPIFRKSQATPNFVHLYFGLTENWCSCDFRNFQICKIHPGDGVSG